MNSLFILLRAFSVSSNFIYKLKKKNPGELFSYKTSFFPLFFQENAYIRVVAPLENFRRKELAKLSRGGRLGRGRRGRRGRVVGYAQEEKRKEKR